MNTHVDHKHSLGRLPLSSGKVTSRSTTFDIMNFYFQTPYGPEIRGRGILEVINKKRFGSVLILSNFKELFL